MICVDHDEHGFSTTNAKCEFGVEIDVGLNLPGRRMRRDEATRESEVKNNSGKSQVAYN